MKHINNEVVVIISNKLQIPLYEDEWNKVLKVNQELLIKFDAHSKNLNLSDGTRINNFKAILRFAKGLKKSFKFVKKEDINTYFLRVNGASICKINYMYTLKSYFDGWIKLRF